jgi:hypothetical protein
VSRAAPGRVLRLAIAGWGLGHLALGRRIGAAWLAAELVALATTGILTVLLVDTTWYLLPFACGAAFMILWALQAVLAYRHAIGDVMPDTPTPRRSPAASIAWLTLPLLVWGTGFWLVAGGAGSPQAVLDRFETAWPQARAERLLAFEGLSAEAAALDAAAGQALQRLVGLCAAGQLTEDCASSPAALLRDVRLRVDSIGPEGATAVAELVTYERHETSFFGIFDASELEPVPVLDLLTLELTAEPAALGSKRWTIAGATPLGDPG